MKSAYKIIGRFKCNGDKMVVVKMNGAACTMNEEDYNEIVIAEQQYDQQDKIKIA